MTHGWIQLLAAITIASAATLATPAVRAESADTISACISSQGRVRVISTRDLHRQDKKRGWSPCRRGERLVRWNVEGPRGPQGSAGMPGPQGPQGPAGAGFSGTQFLTLGNGDLRPVGTSFFGTSFGPPPGGTFATSAAPLLAAVHIPQGARILGLSAHVFDNSTSDLTIELIEQRLSDGQAFLLAAASSSGAAGAPYAVNGTMPGAEPVDNEHLHYFVRVSPTPGWTATTLQVLGVTIRYTMDPVPGT